jgi:anti-sigma factor RsiW
MSLLSKDIACREAVELVTSYLEDTMSRGERKRFERHLEHCDGCAAYLDQVRETIRATGSVGPEDLDPEVLDGLVLLYHEFQLGAP